MQHWRIALQHITHHQYITRTLLKHHQDITETSLKQYQQHTKSSSKFSSRWETITHIENQWKPYQTLYSADGAFCPQTMFNKWWTTENKLEILWKSYKHMINTMPQALPAPIDVQQMQSNEEILEICKNLTNNHLYSAARGCCPIGFQETINNTVQLRIRC